MSFGPDLEWHPKPSRQRHPFTRRRVLKWFLITLGLLTAGFVALIAFVVIQLNGGLPWAFTTAPKPSDPQVVAANNAGNIQREKLMTGLQTAGTRAGFSAVAVSLPDQLCTQGQHNWKIHNNFDLQCSTSTTLVLGSELPFDSRAKTQLVTFDDQMTVLGWQPNYGTTTMTSLKDLVAQDTGPVTPNRPAPFLDDGSHADYFHGHVGGQGSATIYIRFTAGVSAYPVQSLNDVPFGTTSPKDGTVAYQNTRTYLNGPKRYVILIDLTYQSFSG